MAFCPFMSNAREKVECTSNCMLFYTEENNLQVWDKARSGCGFNINSSQLMEITQQIKQIKAKTDHFRFRGDDALKTSIN